MDSLTKKQATTPTPMPTDSDFYHDYDPWYPWSSQPHGDHLSISSPNYEDEEEQEEQEQADDEEMGENGRPRTRENGPE